MYCETCCLEFRTQKGLNIHRTRLHYTNNLELHTCSLCGKLYRSKKSFNNHINCHIDNSQPQIFRYTCNLCDDSFSTDKLLKDHLLGEHKMHIVNEIIYFDSYQKMDKYLDIIRRTQKETFYKTTGNKKTGSKTTSYFKCSHNSETISCISFITTTIFSNNKFKLNFCLYHNHNVDYDKIKLPIDVKSNLISKIRQKIPLKEIYKNLLQGVGESISKKSDMITLNYLRYLKYRYSDPKRFNINVFESLQYNLKLVSEKNPSTFTYLQTPKKEPNLKDSSGTFTFAFSSPLFNPETLDKRLTIMSDATFGTNMYNYSLIVYGHLSSRITFTPILYIVTNSETQLNCENILQKFKIFGNLELKADFFMSDMSPIFYKAWNTVFGNNPKRLYCLWHVKKAVHKQIHAKIKNTEYRFAIEKKFEELTKIYCGTEFKQKLGIFERYCERKSKNFSDYFKKFYSCVYERWCLSSRIDSLVNTNMFVEAFFGEFKRTYLCFSSRNRLDFIFNALLLFEKHRNVTLKRQNHSKQLQYMNYRTQIAHRKHKLSLELNKKKFVYDPVHKLFRYKQYEITEGTCTNCSINCFHICTHCKVCKYRYVCSCLSFASKKEFCKHVHAAHELYEVMKERNYHDCLEGGKLVTESSNCQDESNRTKIVTASVVDINNIGSEEVQLSRIYNDIIIEEPHKNSGSEDVAMDKTESTIAFKTDLEYNTSVNSNVKNNNSIKNKISEQMCELKIQIAETDDSMILGNIHEEIQLLNNFMRYSKDASVDLDMKIDSKMMKKQRTQRSWYR